MGNRWDNVYRPVKPWSFYTQLAVPTIFGDSLSYLEDVSKISYTLNEVISSLNGIPKFVDDAIQAAFDDSGIQEEIKNILAENVIDAKNPPEGLKPVVGDGVTNDTNNFQQILNFAGNKAVAEGVKKLVSLPAGVYSVDQLNIPDNVSLVGETVYTTIIKAQDYSNTTLLAANLSYSVIGNVTFDANSSKNQTYPTVLDLTVNKDSKMQNVRVVNCNPNQDAVLIDNKDVLMIDNLYTEGKNTITGDTGYIEISNLCVKGAVIGVTLNCNNGNILGYLPINCPTAIVLYGDSNYVNISAVKGASDYIDNGELNTIHFSGEVIKEWLESLDISANTTTLKLGDTTVNANTYTEDIADDKHTIVKGDKTVSAGTLTVDVDTDLDVTAASSMEVITNGKEINAGDLTTRVVGEDSLTAEAISRVANTVTASAQIFSGVVASAQVITKKATLSGDTLKTDFKETTLAGETVKIDATNPIVYREKQKLDDNFDYIPFQTPSGENISVLVYNGKPLDPGGGEEPAPTVAPIYLNVKDYGAKGDGTTDDTQAFINAGQGNGYIFVPYGTYLISTASLTSGIKGMLGEMSTIKSAATTGNMLTFAGQWANVSNIILDAPDAENAVSGLNGIILDKVVINGDAEGQIIAMGCRVNNASTVKLSGVSRLASSTLNANISLAGGLTAEITGCQVSGSFVLDGVTESNKVFGLAVSGNVFQPAVTLSDSLFTNLRISGNVGIADYPVIKMPEIPDPFNYNIPHGQQLTFLGADEDHNFKIYVDGNNYLYMVAQNGYTTKIPLLIGSNGTLEIATPNFAVDANGNLNTNNITAKKALTALDGLSVSGLYNLHGTQLLDKGGTIVFLDSDGNQVFRYNNLGDAIWLQKYVNGSWVDILAYNANYTINRQAFSVPDISGLEPTSTGGIRFSLAGYQARLGVMSATGHLQLQYKDGKDTTYWAPALDMDINGNITFSKNIIAPNISTASSGWKSIVREDTFGKSANSTLTISITGTPLGTLWDKYTDSQRARVFVYIHIISGLASNAKVRKWGVWGSNNALSSNATWGSALDAGRASYVEPMYGDYFTTLNVTQYYYWERESDVPSDSTITYAMAYLDLN